MDLDHTFLWIAVASCALVILRSLPALRQGRVSGWVIVSALILAVAGAAWRFFPARAGAVAGGLWLVFLLLPTFLIRAMLRSAVGQRYAAALRLARAIRWLHPADGWREQPIYYRALALAQAGRRDEAVGLLNRFLARPNLPVATAYAFRVQLLRILGQWEESLAWIKGLGEQKAGTPLDEASSIRVGIAGLDDSFLPLCLRTLGETGRLRELVAAYRKESARPDRSSQQLVGSASQLYLFAFGGREAAVAALFEGALAAMPRPARAFWLHTAQMTAGDADAARTHLRELAAADTDPDLQQACARRLAHDLPAAAQVLSPAEQEALSGIEAAAGRDHVFHPLPAGGLRRAYVTLLLVALNLGMFSLEVARGGSEEVETLYRLGAMAPYAVWHHGQWYRLLTAMFLHAGPLHLGMNLLALLVIGPWVEKTLGRVRYLAVYLFTGVGSMAAVLLFMQAGWTKHDLLVGASGAIMGLIGATGALLALGWRRERSALAARRLRGVALIVILQVVFDVMTPQVSFAAHASGIVLGFLVTALLVALPAGGRRARVAEPFRKSAPTPAA